MWDQVAFVDIFASAQPGPPHAAPIEIVGEGSLDDFPPHCLLADPRTHSCPSRGAASQQHVSDFHKRPRFNEVPLPCPIVDVEKYLDDQDLVNVFAVFR
jgi:hypothetical protein